MPLLSPGSLITYDPRLAELIKECETDWGDPAVNKDSLIVYQICKEFDEAVWGLDLVEGELITVQAPEKNRKTTFLANLALHFALQMRQKGFWVGIDTLESGMSPKAYRDVLIAIMATRVLIGKVYGMKRHEWPVASVILSNEDLAKEMHLTRRFLRYGNRTALQNEAIETAKKVLAACPLTLWGSAKKAGNARNLEKTIARWEQLYEGKFVSDELTIEGCPHRIFVCDNIQQYTAFAGSSYYGMEEVTNTISNFVASHPGAIVFAVSQVSLTSVRAAASGDGEVVSRGGSRLAEESNTVFQTGYDRDKKPDEIKLTTPRSRFEPPPTVLIPLERNSGTFLGPATLAFA